jgi:CrcB protein
LDKLFWVGIGGATGAILRYVVSGHVQNQVKVEGFPFGTLAVNLVGCLLIGFLSQVVRMPERFASESTLLIFVGALGAFTTFSTFSKEALDLFASGRVTAALVDIGIHIVLGLAAVGGGYQLGRILNR